VVKILLSYRADPFLKDVDGDDALTFARNNGHTEVATLLQGIKR
jgi:ankyrin repeat protein